MGGALSYQRVGSCDACSGTFTLLNGHTSCKRCKAQLCRRCYARSCAFSVSGYTIALPVLRRLDTCDECQPDAQREAAFTEECMAFLSRGEVLVRIIPSVLGGASTQPVWVTLAPASRCVRWHSMELRAQQPKDAGEIALSDVAGVQVGAAAASGAGLTGTVAGLEAGQCIRLINARGHSLLILQAADARHFKRWSHALSEAVALAAMQHSTVFPPASAVSGSGAGRASGSSGAGSGSGGGAKAGAGGGGGGGGGPGLNPAALAREQDRESRTAAREQFRASLGPVGMAHTARIMSQRQEEGRSSAGGGGGSGGGGGGGGAGSGGSNKAAAVGSKFSSVISAITQPPRGADASSRSLLPGDRGSSGSDRGSGAGGAPRDVAASAGAAADKAAEAVRGGFQKVAGLAKSFASVPQGFS